MSNGSEGNAEGEKRYLLDRLTNISNCTASDYKLIRYFESSYPKVAMETLEQIANANSVSIATVTRFVKKLGYPSFKEFTQQIRQEVLSELDSPTERIDHSPATGAGSVLQEHIQSAIKDLQYTSVHISESEFESIADIIADDSKSLFLLSSASGRALTYWFSIMLKYQRGKVSYLRSIDTFPHQLVDMGESPVLFVSMFDRQRKEYKNMMELFKRHDGTVILLTNRRASPLRNLADYTLFVNPSSDFKFKSRILYQVVFESLLSAIYQRNKKRTDDRSNRIEEFNKELGLILSPQELGILSKE